MMDIKWWLEETKCQHAGLTVGIGLPIQTPFLLISITLFMGKECAPAQLWHHHRLSSAYNVCVNGLITKCSVKRFWVLWI